MLNDLLINFRWGRTKAGLPADGFLTCPVDGEPVDLLIEPSDGLRGGGGGICWAELRMYPSTGDSVKLSSRLGIDEHDRPLAAATLPNRKGGNWFSEVSGRCGTYVVERAFVRVNEGRVTGRLRLEES